jgi:hypothetical protein
MRGFAYLAVTVLIVIAIGVGIVGGVNGGRLGPVGTVSGRLVEEGGLSAIPRPLTGQVTLTNTGGASFTAGTGSNGLWSLEVPPGTYVLAGSSPNLHMCERGVRVRVHAGGTVRPMVVCAVL